MTSGWQHEHGKMGFSHTWCQEEVAQSQTAQPVCRPPCPAIPEGQDGPDPDYTFF